MVTTGTETIVNSTTSSTRFPSGDGLPRAVTWGLPQSSVKAIEKLPYFIELHDLGNARCMPFTWAREQASERGREIETIEITR
jgi:hypothetical protein